MIHVRRAVTFAFAVAILCTWSFALGIGSIHVSAVDSLFVDDPSVSGSSGGSGGAAVSDVSEISADHVASGEGVSFAGDGTITADSLEIVAQSVMLAADQQLDEFPSGAGMQTGVYMSVTTSEFGDITIWIPSNYQYRSFALNDNGVPVNITSSTVTGYYYGNQDYSVRWSSFGQASYRPVNGTGYEWDALTIEDVSSSNVDMGQDQYLLLPSEDMLLYMILFVIGAGVIWICTR